MSGKGTTNTDAHQCWTCSWPHASDPAWRQVSWEPGALYSQTGAGKVIQEWINGQEEHVFIFLYATIETCIDLANDAI